MALGVGRKVLVMVGVLLVGVLLAVLNQTLLSPALPAIMGDLQVDATTVQWLTSGYSLVEAVVIPLSAYLIGRFSTRQLFISAFALFTAGSLAAAVAPNFWVLLLGRVLQASCTGMSMPMVFTVILLVFPREKRGTAMGVIGLIIGFAPAVGPSVAGLLVDSVGWRALFAIVTVLSVVVIVLSLVLCPVTFVALMAWMDREITWYMVFACMIGAFIVALVAMDGWERLKEIWDRTGYRKKPMDKS